MKGAASLFVAWRYLLGRSREGGRYLRGAALGIAVSLVPLVVTLLVADGMIQGITERFVELGTYHAQAIDFSAVAMDPDILARRIMRDGLAEAAWPEAQGLGIAVGPGGKGGATVRAVDPGFLESPGVSRYLKALEGKATLDDPKDALVGEELARKTGAVVGGPLRLMTVRTDSSGRTVPRVTTFTVAGIVSSGYRELDALWLFVPYRSVRPLLSADAARFFVGLSVAAPFGDIDAELAPLAATLPQGYALYSWKELQRTQYASYESTRQLLILIMSLIVLVATANVSSATSMLALERRREIAVLKSFGAGPRFTSSVFVFGGFLSGLIGGALGLAAGLLLSVNVNGVIRGLELALGWLSLLGGGSGAPVQLLDPSYYLESIPVTVEFTPLATIFCGTVVLSTVASWLPARRAGKEKPLPILRKL